MPIFNILAALYLNYIISQLIKLKRICNLQIFLQKAYPKPATRL